MAAEPRNSRAPCCAPAPTAFRQLHPLVGRPLSRPLLSVASSPLTEPDPTPVSCRQERQRHPRGRGAALVTSRTGLATLQRPQFSPRRLEAEATHTQDPQLSYGSAAYSHAPESAAPNRHNDRPGMDTSLGRCSVLRPSRRRAPRPRPGDPLVLLPMRSAQHRG